MANNQQSSASSLLPPAAKRMKKAYSIGPVMNSHEESYLDSVSADVHFVFGSADSGALSSPSERVPAHKIILARDSKVFKAMFYGPMKENGDIRLTDVSEAAFKVFLQFFYLTEADLTVDNLADIMHLGHKYDVARCIGVCVKFFKENHNNVNILIGLGLGILYENLELMTLCERFIARNTFAVFNGDFYSNGFLDCDRQLLAHILNANLFVCSEVELFRSCMQWVKAKSGHDDLLKEIVDEHLGELFYNIRFGSMTIEEFCKLSVQYRAVLSNDFETITKLIVLPNIQQDRFNTQSRQIKWSDATDAVVKCNREEEGCFEECITENRVETITFSTNKEFLLTGFTINKIRNEWYDDYYYCVRDDTKYPVEVKIYEIDEYNENVRLVLKMNVNIPHDESTEISLSKPILMNASNGDTRSYEISIEFPRQCYEVFMYRSKALKQKVKLDSGTVIKFLDCKKSKNGTNVGMISALEFNRV